MTRSFKPLLGAVALAAAAFTSSTVFAAYNYNVVLTVAAPKGSAAEAAAKDKTQPTSIKYTTCNLANADGSSTGTLDQLNFSVKYDAGKADSELADVHLMLQGFTTGGPQYYPLVRTNGITGGVALAGPAITANALTVVYNGLAGKTYLAKEDNPGIGAQSEVLFGNNVTLTGLPKGVWALTAVIAKPGYRTVGAPGADPLKIFKFEDRKTWAAFDTVPFVLGTPFEVSTTAAAGLIAGAWPTLSATCQ